MGQEGPGQAPSDKKPLTQVPELNNPLRNIGGGPKNRTELKIGGSGAKNCAERHENVRFGVAPQKPTKNCKKRIL